MSSFEANQAIRETRSVVRESKRFEFQTLHLQNVQYAKKLLRDLLDDLEHIPNHAILKHEPKIEQVTVEWVRDETDKEVIDRLGQEIPEDVRSYIEENKGKILALFGR